MCYCLFVTLHHVCVETTRKDSLHGGTLVHALISRFARSPPLPFQIFSRLKSWSRETVRRTGPLQQQQPRRNVRNCRCNNNNNYTYTICTCKASSKWQQQQRTKKAASQAFAGRVWLIGIDTKMGLYCNDDGSKDIHSNSNSNNNKSYRI